MKKTLILLVVLFLVLSAAACGPKYIDMTGIQELEEALENIEGLMQQDDTNDIDDTAAGEHPAGLPSGFPPSVPIYPGAQILEAESYDNDGFTLVYQADDAYRTVVDFYVKSIPGLDKASIGDDESYFEGIDLDGSVRISGLTIMDMGDSTMVFLFVGDYSHFGLYSDDDDYDDINETEGDYASLVGGTLPEGYPKNVVPLFDTVKITASTRNPSETRFSVEGIAPPNSFEDAVAFYQNSIGGTPNILDTPSMRTAEFGSSKDGWSIRVTVADIYSSGNTAIQISLSK